MERTGGCARTWAASAPHMEPVRGIITINCCSGGAPSVLNVRQASWCVFYLLLCLCQVLKNVEDDQLNDSLENPGLISPDKEDLARLLVCKMLSKKRTAPGCA